MKKEHIKSIGFILTVLGYLALPIIILSVFFVELLTFSLLLSVDAFIISTGNLLIQINEVKS